MAKNGQKWPFWPKTPKTPKKAKKGQKTALFFGPQKTGFLGYLKNRLSSLSPEENFL
jgi:hypothetical protein